MAIPPRWLWIRVAVWAVIIAAVAFMMRRPDVSDEVGRAALDAMGMGPAPTWTPLTPPAAPRPPADPSGDVTVAIQAVQELDAACVPAGSVLRLHLGPGGLEGADSLGLLPACAATALWGAQWPSVPAAMEIEVTRG